jgi:hypothetical protein
MHHLGDKIGCCSAHQCSFHELVTCRPAVAARLEKRDPQWFFRLEFAQNTGTLKHRSVYRERRRCTTECRSQVRRPRLVALSCKEFDNQHYFLKKILSAGFGPRFRMLACPTGWLDSRRNDGADGSSDIATLLQEHPGEAVQEARSPHQLLPHLQHLLRRGPQQDCGAPRR